MNIGVLALQGDFIEHQIMLEKLGVTVTQVRLAEHLINLSGLIIPGGESTTIGKLASAYDMIEPLRTFGQQKAIWGTCAGAIFLSKNIGKDQPILGLMNITVERNAFGRQINSFEANLDIPVLSKVSQGKNIPYPAVFIRAPVIESVSGSAQILSQLDDGRIVAVQQDRLLATSFHPELTADDRFHRYFLELAQSKSDH